MSKEYGKTLLWLNELNQNKIKPGLERIKEAYEFGWKSAK